MTVGTKAARGRWGTTRSRACRIVQPSITDPCKTGMPHVGWLFEPRLHSPRAAYLVCSASRTKDGGGGASEKLHGFSTKNCGDTHAYQQNAIDRSTAARRNACNHSILSIGFKGRCRVSP